MRYSVDKLYKITVIMITAIAMIFLSMDIIKQSKDKEDNYMEESIKDVNSNSDMDKTIEEMFETRNTAILKKDIETLKSIYDLESKLGQWAYEHEIKKMKYIENWSEKQGVEFTEINPKVIIKKIKENENVFSAYLLSSTEYKYKYKNDETLNVSRIGSYHVIDIIEKDGKLKIVKEWYDDPFADSMDLENFQDKEITLFIGSQSPKEHIELSENRKKAVAYANKYCGAASQEQYGFKYNKDYIDYNSQGGDCTNFISQVLLQGGFSKDQAWNYNSSGASRAWVNAAGFKDYILYSNKASLISSGDYKSVYKSSYNLIPGDVISYEKKGKVSHTAVVSAVDSKGYPLVTCHNVDRNNVPWDLGFNGKNIKFHLIKMNY